MAEKRTRRKHTKAKSTGRVPMYDTGRMRSRTINMPDSMYERLGEEAAIRELKGGESDMARKIFEWFFDAIDRQRGDADTNKIFDEVLKNPT